MSGKDKFEQFFSDIYNDRWSELLSSLQHKEKKFLRPVFNNQFDYQWQDMLDGPFLSDVNRELLNETLNSKKRFYAMDLGSIYAASLLEILPMSSVLDMCAAPGGKSLILLEKLNDGNLTVNEISQNRRIKLKNVLREYAPEEKLEQITVKGLDGLQYGLKFAENFDAILLDAPCSGERHLLHTPSELEKWSPKRSKRLAGIQYGLLCSALLALKEQGQIVYSTCSISPLENDLNIEKLLKKKGEYLELDLPNEIPSFMERTEFGLIALPDKKNAGPLYVTRLRKIKSTR